MSVEITPPVDGAGGYAAGTDRFAISFDYVNFDPEASDLEVDFRGIDGGSTSTPGPAMDPYVTRIGSIFDLDELQATGALTFLSPGCYAVKTHLTQGIGVAAALKILLLNQAADGDDTSASAADPRGPSVHYVWCHTTGDVVTVKIEFPAPPGLVNLSLSCQVVKLSEVAPPEDEFDPAYSGDLSALLA